MSERHEERLRHYLDELQGDLPTLPTVAADLLRLSDAPEATPKDFADLIQRDPALAARILRVANSSLYGLASEIQSLQHAIGMLGFRTIRNLTLAASMKGTYKRYGVVEQRLCEHSVIAGPVTAAIAQHLVPELDTHDAFTAGLLHDLGKTALANTHPELYQQVMESVDNENLSYAEAERAAFGFDHAALGGQLARRWGLPSTLAEVIRLHHDPLLWHLMREEDARFVAVVALSTACLTRLGVGRRAPIPELELSDHPACEVLEIDKTEVMVVLERCEEAVTQARLLIA